MFHIAERAQKHEVEIKLLPSEYEMKRKISKEPTQHRIVITAHKASFENCELMDAKRVAAVSFLLENAPLHAYFTLGLCSASCTMSCMDANF